MFVSCESQFGIIVLQESSYNLPNLELIRILMGEMCVTLIAPILPTHIQPRQPNIFDDLLTTSPYARIIFNPLLQTLNYRYIS